MRSVPDEREWKRLEEYSLCAATSNPRNAGGKTPREVREMFGRVVRRYDFLNHLLSLGLDRRWRRLAARELSGTAAGEWTLDCCAGTGDLALAFHRAAPQARILALDFTHAMVCRGAAKSPRAGRSAGSGRRHNAATPLCFGLADALALPLRDDSMAAAGIAFGLRNVADPVKAIGELARVVRPGGKVLVLEFSMPAGRFFGLLYRFYFHRVLPRVADWLTRGAGDAYRYLPDSVDAFVSPKGVARLLRDAGMAEVRAMSLAGGAVHLHVGRKAGPSDARQAT